MLKRPINVLHVISRLPVGGVERQLSAVLRNYDRQKIMPFVCSLSDRGEVGLEIQAMGIELICLNKLGHGFSVSLVSHLIRIMKDKRIDVVRTHQYHANLYGRIAAVICRIPCIVPSIHNVYTRDRKLHRRILNNLLGRLSDAVIAVSEAVKDDVMTYDNIPSGRLRVIYNGIEEVRFTGNTGAEIRSEFNLPENAVIVGSVGRLTTQKGQQYLVEAVASLVKDFPGLRLLMVGDGPDKAVLLRLVREKGLEGRVIFTGSRDDVPHLLAAMDIFVFPSLWEGLPNALVEAMAAGKAIIATNIKPNREVLGSEDAGMFVTSKDSMSIASGIAALIRNRTLARQLGAAAQARAFSRFTVAGTVLAYTTLFEDILSAKGWITYS